LEVRLGKVQRVKAIDDGGVSFRFRREFESNLQSQRVILSVEVKPFPNHSNKPRRSGKSTPGRTTKTQQIAMPLRYSLKCSVKCVIKNTMTCWTMNIRRYRPHQLTALTIVLCNSYSTCQNSIILCQITKHISLTYRRTWRKIFRKVSEGQSKTMSFSALSDEIS
jgi:hypothetical protein